MRDGQGCHAVELGHAEVRHDDVRSKFAQLVREILFRIDDAMLDRQSRAFQLAQIELRVAAAVFGKQDADAFGQGHGRLTAFTAERNTRRSAWFFGVVSGGDFIQFQTISPDTVCRL